MKKETFSDKMIKRFYGITGPLDEQKRQQAEHLGNISFIWLFLILQVGNFLAFMLADIYPGLDARIYPIIIELLTFIIAGIIYFRSEKEHLADLDLELMSEKERRKLQYPGLKIAIFVGLTFHPIFSLVEAVTLKQDFFTLFLQADRILKTALVASILGIFISFYFKSRKHHTEQSE